MPTLSNLLNYIDWKDLTNGLPGRFHGDLHFENILYDSKKKKFYVFRLASRFWR